MHTVHQVLFQAQQSWTQHFIEKTMSLPLYTKYFLSIKQFLNFKIEHTVNSPVSGIWVALNLPAPPITVL